MFWKKKDNTGIIVAITNLRLDVDEVKSKVKQLELEQLTLENYVKNKIKKSRPKDDEETQDINNTVLLPDNGFTKHYKGGSY